MAQATLFILATSTLVFVILIWCIGIGWIVSPMIACAVEAAVWLGYRVGALWAFRSAEPNDENDAGTRLVVRRTNEMERIVMFLVIGGLFGLLATASGAMVSLFAVFGIAVAIANMRLYKIA